MTRRHKILQRSQFSHLEQCNHTASQQRRRSSSSPRRTWGKNWFMFYLFCSRLGFVLYIPSAFEHVFFFMSICFDRILTCWAEIICCACNWENLFFCYVSQEHGLFVAVVYFFGHRARGFYCRYNYFCFAKSERIYNFVHVFVSARIGNSL